MPEQLTNSLWIALGGALGTLARHGLNLAAAASAFPAGTLVANVVGSLLLGLLAGWASRRMLRTRWTQYGFGVGFCGGFTTMSTFAADTTLLARTDTPALAAAYVAAYVAASLIGALLLVSLGHALGARLAGRTSTEGAP